MIKDDTEDSDLVESSEEEEEESPEGDVEEEYFDEEF